MSKIAIIAAVASLTIASLSQAAVVVTDSYDKANQSFNAGTSETSQAVVGTNLTGTTYKWTGGGGGDARYDTQTAQMHNGGGVGLPLGIINDNNQMTIAADISFLNNAVGNIQTTGYALLGFFTQAGTGNYNPGTSRQNFTGLQVNLDGSIALVTQGTVGTAINYGVANNAYNPATAQRLQFSVDTTTGSLTAITFGTSSATYSFTTTGVTAARTEYVGIGGSLNNSPNYVVFNNFSLEAANVPEPTSLALLGLGATGLLARRRK